MQIFPYCAAHSGLCAYKIRGNFWTQSRFIPSGYVLISKCKLVLFEVVGQSQDFLIDRSPSVWLNLTRKCTKGFSQPESIMAYSCLHKYTAPQWGLFMRNHSHRSWWHRAGCTALTSITIQTQQKWNNSPMTHCRALKCCFKAVPNKFLFKLWLLSIGAACTCISSQKNVNLYDVLSHYSLCFELLCNINNLLVVQSLELNISRFCKQRQNVSADSVVMMYTNLSVERQNKDGQRERGIIKWIMFVQQ